MTDETANPTETAAKPKFDASETKYFGPSSLEQAGEYASLVQAFADASKIPVYNNFNDDPDNQITDGFGLLIQPVQKRNKAKQELEVTHYVFAQVPDISAVSADEKGAHYIREVLKEAFGRRLKQIVVAAVKAAQKPQLPSTLSGFIEAIRARSPLYTFNQLQERVRKSLAKKNVTISKEMLQGVLMSTEFAKQVFPQQAQQQWEMVIDRMMAVAKAENLDPAILEQWRTTRNEQSFSHDDTADFADLDI